MKTAVAIIASLVIAVNGIECEDPVFFVLPELTKLQTEASAACQAVGATIASYHNQDEFDEATLLCEKACESWDNNNFLCGCWSGLQKNQSTGVWYNEDGSPNTWGFNKDGTAIVGGGPWHEDEPNNYKKHENCTAIWKHFGYDLNDVPCVSKQPYMPMCRIENDLYFPIEEVMTNGGDPMVECESKGGFLASFHSDEQYQKAAALCRATCLKYDAGNDDCGCYVGVRMDQTTKKWFNVDGSNKDYVMDSKGNVGTGIRGNYPWGNGQPNNLYGNEYCVHIWTKINALLYDVRCKDDNFAICRKPQYFALNQKKTQAAAAAECINQNGVIASFHSDCDFKKASALCNETCGNLATDEICGCWTGVRKDDNDVWYNEDGSTKDYLMSATGSPYNGQFPWRFNQPDNWQGREQCAHILSRMGYELNDQWCNRLDYAICEDRTDFITQNVWPAPFDFLNDLAHNGTYDIYWLIGLVVICTALLISCLVMTYGIVCKTKNVHKYNKVVMMGSDTEVDVM